MVPHARNCSINVRCDHFLYQSSQSSEYTVTAVIKMLTYSSQSQNKKPRYTEETWMNINIYQSPELQIISNLYRDESKIIKCALESKNNSNLKAYE